MWINLEYMDLWYKGIFEIYIEIIRNGMRKNEIFIVIYVYK